jgi:hypothetical protein
MLVSKVTESDGLRQKSSLKLMNLNKIASKEQEHICCIQGGFRSLSYDVSTASSEASSVHSAI